MCSLMKQRLVNDEDKNYLEKYNFQGIHNEQQALLFSIIKLVKKNVTTLYKKCFNFISVKHVRKGASFSQHMEESRADNGELKKHTFVYFKDAVQEKRQYLEMARKMADLYEEMKNKASFFRMSIEKIFESHQAYKHIESDSIFKGFFFLFVYKDFVLRDVIARIKECLPNEKNIKVLDMIELEYECFMEAELVQWVNLLLSCEVFQSYSCIVSPNEQTNPYELNARSPPLKARLPPYQPKP